MGNTGPKKLAVALKRWPIEWENILPPSHARINNGFRKFLTTHQHLAKRSVDDISPIITGTGRHASHGHVEFPLHRHFAYVFLTCGEFFARDQKKGSASRSSAGETGCLLPALIQFTQSIGVKWTRLRPD
jgi:hypothetical protein